jgi:uncharacterized membrane protein YphA (DoxX/SURF4 family)
MFSQKTRAIIFIVYVLLLFFANFVAFGTPIPSTGVKGLWFYTGLASVILGSLLVTPFYTKPVDAISYSVVTITALFLSITWNSWNHYEKIAYILTISYSIFVLIAAFLAIIYKDSKNDKIKKFSITCKILCDYLGNQEAIFSTIILYSVFVYHRSSVREVYIILLAWIIIVIVKPEKILFKIYERLYKIWFKRVLISDIGDIAGFQSPGLILVRQTTGQKISFGLPLIFKDEHAALKIGIALDYTGRDEGLLLRTIEIDTSTFFEDKLLKIIGPLPNNSISLLEKNEEILELLKPLDVFNKIDQFVGVVSQETSVNTLYFEVIQECDLEEGRLVEVYIRGKAAIYQVIDGMTKEEVIYKKNTFGFVRAKAKKIGLWQHDKKKFIPIKWLPKANTPVYIIKTDTYEQTKEAIGHFEGTNYSLSIKNINDLVTHNTAILGILGIGKSMLAIELIERMIRDNIKVICLDLTNQYANELKEYYDQPSEETILKTIQEAGERDQDKWAENPQEGGSLPNLTQAIFVDLKEFLKKDNEQMIKIYNPAKLFAKKQISDPKSFQSGGQWQRAASLWTITPVEVTKIVTELVLEICQDEMSDKARVCLVFEEAHSLIPEWGTAACEGDRTATNATARAILQGRKYGLGCLLITQRTANVTKTILNQCNTVFAMRTFDDTGKNFLSNYIGSEHADILPNLQERCAVLFGKASSCENPVLIRLNDRPNFIKIFRK